MSRRIERGMLAPLQPLAILGALLVTTGATAQTREMGLLPEPEGDLLGFDEPGDVPTIPEDGELVVRKVRPIDCRAVLAFAHTPVDGRYDSWGYNGVVNEYNDSQNYRNGAWQNPSYEHIRRPAIHVTLPEGESFNYLYLRGGFIGDVFTGVDALDGPGGGTRIARVDHVAGAPASKGESPTTVYSHHQIGRVAMPDAVTDSRISFFREEGLLADAQFLAVGNAPAEKYAGSIPLYAGARISDATGLGLDFRRIPAPANPDRVHPSNFERRFFRDTDRTIHALSRRPHNEALALAANQQLHLVSDVLPAKTPIGAVRVDLHLQDLPAGSLVNLAVQDPLSGNQELIRVDVRAPASGRVRALLDFPDALMPDDGRFWLTIASQHAATLAPDSSITLMKTEPAKANEEHLAWRLFLLKGYFSVMSEQRPWRAGWNLKFILENDGANWQNFQRHRPQLIDLYRTVEHLHKLYPDHPIASRQYYDFLTRFDRPAFDPGAVPNLPNTRGVPRWAFLLDHAAQRLVEIPMWWIENRMAPNGEFGGFYSDDTDMVQWWVPSALIDSESFRPIAERVFTLIAEGVQQHNLRDGVNLHSTDPLHAYEEGQNHMAVMPLLFYGNPQYVEELMRAAASVEKWMKPTPEGHLRFNAMDVGDFGWNLTQHPYEETSPKDFNNTALLLHSHLTLAWYNRHPLALETLKRFADYEGGGVEGSYGGGPSISFGVYWLTGDPKYLALDKSEDGQPPRGWTWTRDLPAFPIHGRRHAESQPWWNRYYNSVRNRPSAIGWALSLDRDLLVRALEQALYGNPRSGSGGADRYRYMWTEAEQFTDRVFLPVEDVAQAMLGGFTVRNKIWPSYAVSYEGLGKDFAGLVLEQGKDRLKVALVNLANKPREGAFRVWQLDHGVYELAAGVDTNDDGDIDGNAARSRVTLARMDAVPVTLPPKRVIIYELRQVRKLDDLYARADLAIGVPDITVRGDEVSVTIHNIGSADAENVRVALLDDRGEAVNEATIDRLDAPRDYRPRTATVSLPLSPRAVRIAIDPQNDAPEITELNNVLELPR